MFGYAFLSAGITKLTGGGWTAQGYHAGGAARNGNQFEFSYVWMADANWFVAFVNSDLAYVLVFLAIAAFGAGRISRIDAYVERYEFADGRTALEKYPRLDYVLE